MFTSSERTALRSALLDRARADSRITGGAITGSASVNREDAWSDIDLAFGVRTGVTLEEVLGDFTAVMTEEHSAVDWFDVFSGAWTYRVFLLASTLQVDLAFAPEDQFGARAPTFQLQFGESADLPPSQNARTEDAFGMAWLYGLHVRSSLRRGRLWQAEFFLSAMRNQVLVLACRRLNLPDREGRGYHLLPNEVLGPLAKALPANLDVDSVQAALQSCMTALLAEIEKVDPIKSAKLQRPLKALAGAGPNEG